MGWVKSDYRVKTGQAVLFLTRKQALCDRMLLSIMEKNITPYESPELSEQALAELIVKYRPELKGCSVFHFGYDPSYGRWELSVAHPSLPHGGYWEAIERMPLDPRYREPKDEPGLPASGVLE